VAFENPDHVDTVIHNYRWRLGLVDSDPEYDAVEERLAVAPATAVSTITPEGDANGAPHPEPGVYASKFTGKYEHRILTGGHRAQPAAGSLGAFVKAILDVDTF
jgi:hypothetical protein